MLYIMFRQNRYFDYGNTVDRQKGFLNPANKYAVESDLLAN